MPNIKGGIISGIGRASFSAISIPAVEVAAPDPSDPGFFLQLDNEPQPNGPVGNPVAPRQRLSVARHADPRHDTWSGYVDEQAQDIQDAVQMLLDSVLTVANPAMGYTPIAGDPPIKVK